MILLQLLVVLVALILMWFSVISRKLPKGIIEWTIWIVAAAVFASWIR